MLLSIIIPTLNEQESLPACLQSIRNEFAGQCLVVDGGSTDGTSLCAQAFGATVVSAPRGLASQCNWGAKNACGDTLLFLAADCQLAPGWLAALHTFFQSPYHAAGGFRLKLDHPARSYRWIEWGGNFRARYLGITLPDQGLFVRRGVFEATKGFRELSLIPFARFCFELKVHGEFQILPLEVRSSVRKWERYGRFRTSFHHARTYLRFKQREGRLNSTDSLD